MFRFKQIAGILGNVAIFAALLFIPAGTWRWPHAWIFLGVVLIAGTFSILAIPEDLLNERYKPPVQQGQPLADKVVLIIFLISFLATVVFIPLDVFRFRLLGSPGLVVSWIGLVLFAAGWALISYAMIANTFATTVVRLQEERRQQVVDTGPYRVVRHPMYAAVIPVMLGMALWLGSYAAALVCVVPIALIALRIRFEEKFLRSGLAGYQDYMRRTRFRMVPFVW